MVSDKIQRRLRWALDMYEWGYTKDAQEMLENVARYVSNDYAGPESDEKERTSNGLNEKTTESEQENGFENNDTPTFFTNWNSWYKP